MYFSVCSRQPPVTFLLTDIYENITFLNYYFTKIEKERRDIL